jgi:hypothetical protein
LALERGLYLEEHFSNLILSFEVSDDVNGIFVEERDKNGGFFYEWTDIYSNSIVYY